MSNRSRKYTFAAIATDVAVFTARENRLKIALIKMKKKPFYGKWALPGGLIRADESLEDAARRHLAAKTGVRKAGVEQLRAFGSVHRDPFGRVVSVAFVAFVPFDKISLRTTKEYEDVRLFSVTALPRLAYDHAEIITIALKKLRERIQYTKIAKRMLKREFTLGELQKFHEIVLGETIDKRNFRKKVLSLGLVEKTDKKESGRPNRPARLYRFA